jgi:carbamate kinase
LREYTKILLVSHGKSPQAGKLRQARRRNERKKERKKESEKKIKKARVLRQHARRGKD